MSHNIEYCDPFSGISEDIWMKLEHCGRYLYACDFLEAKRCGIVIDIACSNGYGSEMIAEKAARVIAADRNGGYLRSSHLKHDNIQALCLDFDSDAFPEVFTGSDAIVCFETIEHLKEPFRFLKKITGFLRPGGWLLCSFPNVRYEQLNPDGTNKDTYHLQLIDKDQVIQALKEVGLSVHSVQGQPVCNRCCLIEHDLKESAVLGEGDVDRAFRYDRASILTLSRVLAYPQEEWADESYSYILTARRE